MVYSPGDWDVVAEEVFTSRGRIKVGFLPPERTGDLVLLRLLAPGFSGYASCGCRLSELRR